MAAMLVLDWEIAERSFTTAPPDELPVHDGRQSSIYNATYTDGSTRIFTRFEPGHGTRTFQDEQMYGYWIPGNARDGLLGIVLGGPRPAVAQILHELATDAEIELHLIA